MALMKNLPATDDPTGALITSLSRQGITNALTSSGTGLPYKTWTKQP
jgi:hypothetical protein